MTIFLKNRNLWFYELVLETWVKHKMIDSFIHIHMPDDSSKISSVISDFLTVSVERKSDSICEEAEFVISQFRNGEIVKADDGLYYLRTSVSLTQEEYSSYE